MGVSYVVNLVDADPAEEQIALFTAIIRTMQELPAEFAVFEFQNAKNKPGRQRGLVFCQLCREEGKIHAEIRIDGADCWRMYAAVLEEDDAEDLLRQLVATREAPDLAGWEDITETVVQDEADFE